MIAQFLLELHPLDLPKHSHDNQCALCTSMLLTGVKFFFLSGSPRYYYHGKKKNAEAKRHLKCIHADERLMGFFYILG